MLAHDQVQMQLIYNQLARQLLRLLFQALEIISSVPTTSILA